MAPFETLYGRKCRSLVYWDKMGERNIKNNRKDLSKDKNSTKQTKMLYR